MGVIIKDIEVEGDKGKAVLRTLFDTGASHSLIRKDKAEQLATIVPLAHHIGSAWVMALPSWRSEKVVC